ncbi:MAG: phage holin family protein [Acidobacteriota bacterium]
MKAIRTQDQQVEKEKPGFGELLGRLANESSQLVRAEITLAKEEAKEKITRSADSIKFFALAALLGLGAFLASSTFLIFLLAVWLPIWASAAIVALALGVGALLAVWAGSVRWQRVNLKLEQTMETLEEDKRWIKQLESARQS